MFLHGSSCSALPRPRGDILFWPGRNSYRVRLILPRHSCPVEVVAVIWAAFAAQSLIFVNSVSYLYSVAFFECVMFLLCDQIVQYYLDLLGRGGVSGQAVSRLGNVLSSLVNFLMSLRASLSTQPFSSATNCSQSHCWGQKYSTTKQVSVQIITIIYCRMQTYL